MYFETDSEAEREDVRLMQNIRARAKEDNELARLQRENAELRGAIKAQEERNSAACERVGLPPFGCDTPDHLVDEIESLRAKLEAAEADTRRLDWLSGRDCACVGKWAGDAPFVARVETGGYVERGANLRQAIDAAMGAQRGGK